MATTPAAHVSLEEYLNTNYEPDCDYVDGILEERNVGKKKHARTQTCVGAWLLSNVESKGKDVATEQRVRLSPTRIRIPDVCVINAGDETEVQEIPPDIWVEILSPEDRLNRVLKRLQEVLDFGVPTIWIIDPYENKAWIGTPQTGIQPAKDNVLRCESLDLRMRLEDILL
jgi:Uma2 family endonuclease